MGKPPTRLNGLSVVADQLSALTKLTGGLLTHFLPVCSLNKPYRTSVVPGLHLSDNRVYQDLSTSIAAEILEHRCNRSGKGTR
jgi:hypothetical protein